MLSLHSVGSKRRPSLADPRHHCPPRPRSLDFGYKAEGNLAEPDGLYIKEGEQSDETLGGGPCPLTDCYEHSYCGSGVGKAAGG